MEDIVIDVQSLTKKYEIAVGYQPDTLREKLAEIMKYPFQAINGKHKVKTKIFWALRGLSFQVKRGEVLGVIGQNGAGKSTLLKILSRITDPTSGYVTMQGRVASLLEVGTGFNPELTGRENIYLSGAILGMTRKEINQKMNEIIDFSGVREFIDTPVKRYSSGMYVRLAFAVSAQLESEILLLDEVLAVGDADFQKKSRAKILAMALNEKRTVLFVSHNLEAVGTLCQRSILLDHGEIKFIGDTRIALEKYHQLFAPTHKTGMITSKDKSFTLKIPTWLDKNGKKITAYHFGDPITLKFDFNFKKAQKNINLGMAVVRSDGVRIFTSHIVDDKSYRVPKVYLGRMSLTTSFNISSLAPGTYQIIIGMRDAKRNVLLYEENKLDLVILEMVDKKDGAEGVLWHTTTWSATPTKI